MRLCREREFSPRLVDHFRAAPVKQSALKPAPTLGILGGGQLAKMTAQAATQFGCEVIVFEQREDFPAHSLDTHTIIGNWDDPDSLLKLASVVEIVTLENEFVDADALEVVERRGHKLLPRVATIRTIQDKLVQKRAFAAAGLPVTHFSPVTTPTDVVAFGAASGWPLVLKKRRNSYDGKGNATVNGAEAVEEAWQRLEGTRHALYVEQWCEFAMELATIAVRGQDGQIVTYPVVETVNRDHICHLVKAPAAIAPAIAAQATETARRAVAAIDGVGAFGMEFFLKADGCLLINEIAPRVHNSGHYTIEACECSQFENHVRAVLGWPLGDVRMRVPAAAMVNLLGAGPGSGRPLGLQRALAVAGAHVHIYGKVESQSGRKMGHVTALGATAESACAVAERAAGLIRFGESR